MTEINQRPFTAASFNQFLAEQRLMGSQCGQCGRKYLPPRAICLDCHTDGMNWIELAGEGVISAFTAVYVGPTFMCEQGFGRDHPYLTGIVEVENDLKISTRLLGFESVAPEEVKVGSPVKVEFLQIGDGDHPRIQLAFRAL